MTIDAALAAVGKIGPFFGVRVIPPETLIAESTLASMYGSGPVLGAHVRASAEALGTTDRRVAGSIFFQGLAARLWSPTLAVAAQERRVLHLPPEHSVLKESALACTQPELLPELPVDRDRSSGSNDRTEAPMAGCATALATEIYRVVIGTHVEPLAEVLDVPPTVLWGNAASAAVGSYQVMTAARPDLADANLLRSLLQVGRLADTGRLDRSVRFTRDSCCLFYRVPGGGLCGDCVLHRRT